MSHFICPYTHGAIAGDFIMFDSLPRKNNCGIAAIGVAEFFYDAVDFIQNPINGVTLLTTWCYMKDSKKPLPGL